MWGWMGKQAIEEAGSCDVAVVCSRFYGGEFEFRSDPRRVGALRTRELTRSIATTATQVSCWVSSRVDPPTSHSLSDDPSCPSAGPDRFSHIRAVTIQALAALATALAVPDLLKQLRQLDQQIQDLTRATGATPGAVPTYEEEGMSEEKVERLIRAREGRLAVLRKKRDKMREGRGAPEEKGGAEAQGHGAPTQPRDVMKNGEGEQEEKTLELWGDETEGGPEEFNEEDEEEEAERAMQAYLAERAAAKAAKGNS